MEKRFIILFLTGFFIAGFCSGQKTESDTQKGYTFTMVKQLKATPVKNQHRSGTCWSFASISLIESEMLRMGKAITDLSEMYVVRKSYMDKARRYVRMHGKFNFTSGGAANDAFDVIKKYGMLPEEVYPGLLLREDDHIHGEMDCLLNAMVQAVIKNKNKRLSRQWQKAFKGALDAYLGEVPEKFTYQGKKYTPQSFAENAVSINPDDYVMITSFTHHPFYEHFIIELPDNWSWEEACNVKLEELTETIDHAINNGFSVVWATDVSEKGFSWDNGIAVVPEMEFPETAGMEKEKWDDMSDNEKKKLIYSFENVVIEKNITQEIRQEEFDNYQTTDDYRKNC